MAENESVCRMRRAGFCFFLVVCLMLSPMVIRASAQAETSPEWLGTLSRAEGFETAGEGWVYQRYAARRFTDGSIILGLEAAPYAGTGEVLVCVYASMEDLRGQRLAEITRMSLMIDGRTWSWQSMMHSGNGSFALLGAPERDFLSALSEAKTVTMQIHYLTRHMTVSFREEEMAGLPEAAGNLLPVLDAVDISAESMTGLYETEHPVIRKPDILPGS